MAPSNSKLGKDNTRTYLAQSLKHGMSTSISKVQANHTNIGDVYTPTSSTSHKINIKGSLIAKKCMGFTKKKLEGEQDASNSKRRKKMNNFKILKEPGMHKGETLTETRSPEPKSNYHFASGGGSTKLRIRTNQLSTHGISTSKRIESQMGYRKI